MASKRTVENVVAQAAAAKKQKCADDNKISEDIEYVCRTSEGTSKVTDVAIKLIIQRLEIEFAAKYRLETKFRFLNDLSSEMSSKKWDGLISIEECDGDKQQYFVKISHLLMTEQEWQYEFELQKLWSNTGASVRPVFYETRKLPFLFCVSAVTMNLKTHLQYGSMSKQQSKKLFTQLEKLCLKLEQFPKNKAFGIWNIGCSTPNFANLQTVHVRYSNKRDKSATQKNYLKRLFLGVNYINRHRKSNVYYGGVESLCLLLWTAIAPNYQSCFSGDPISLTEPMTRLIECGQCENRTHPDEIFYEPCTHCECSFCRTCVSDPHSGIFEGADLLLCTGCRHFTGV